MNSAHAAVLLASSSGPSPLWYATRAAGTASLVLLTLSVVVGIAAAGRYAPRNIGRFEVSAVHRNLSLLTLVFLALHIVTAIADSFTHIGWPATVVPLASSYRPVWVGLGAVALDLLLAVAITSAFRQRIGHRWWKAVHWAAYAAWPVALFHAAGTGTDTRLTPQLVLYAACLAAVLGAVWWRLARAGAEARRVRWWVLPATALIPVLLAVFLATGPLRPGWSHRAAATFPSNPSRPAATAPAVPPPPHTSAPHIPEGGDSA
ncbi:ferric reductase-like transmembrane domain-containing protein [Actinacidiphila rubida]|uniref:Ferric reductase like transmembrane component n=1 Tax=Actinacidiphila rubida TaxID=310780 RepID=A0A1H8SJ73_9ACTN|nr:ferric reductase-like transmembrane domain-containing protein [Actinacidiphila rubida]SEO78691.1 Ferric reductase like transmembrane component [Actinacidiphila rubida]